MFRRLPRADAVFSWRPNTGALEAGRGQSQRNTRAPWRHDTGAVEAGCGRSKGGTQAEWTQDAGRHGDKLFLGNTLVLRLTVPPVILENFQNFKDMG